MNETFASRLRMAMIGANLNQMELAERSGASKAAISQYLSGLNIPTAQRMKALADATGVSIDYLMGFEKGGGQPIPSMLRKRISVQDAAKCLGISQQLVRNGLHDGKLPIGVELRGSGTRKRYDIRPHLLRAYAGSELFDAYFGQRHEKTASVLEHRGGCGDAFTECPENQGHFAFATPNR